MKKKWIIITCITTALIVIVILIFVFAPKKEAYMSQDSNNSTSTSQPQNTSMESSAQPTAMPGKYVEYTDEVIANTAGTKVLFFHAPWCPQCRALDASIKAGKIPNDVTIIKVDYDSHEKLRQKYGVTIQTTLVRVDDEGNLVKKFVAYNTPNLEALIKNVL